MLNKDLTQWIEFLVGLSVLIGIPMGIVHRYFKASVVDLDEKLTNSIKILSLNIYADLKEDSLVRKEQTRELMDSFFSGLDSQLEHNNTKLEQLSKDFKHYTEMQHLKDEAFKESVRQDFRYINSLIVSIESYLETKNGYRRRSYAPRQSTLLRGLDLGSESVDDNDTDLESE